MLQAPGTIRFRFHACVPLSLIVNIYGPPWLHCEPLQLQNFDFVADPDFNPAFQSDADPDPDPAPKMMRSGILDPVPMFFVYGPGGVHFMKVSAVDSGKKSKPFTFRVMA